MEIQNVSPSRIGSQEVAMRKLHKIERDFTSHGKMVRGSAAQIMFPSDLPTGSWVLERRRKIDQVNYCLREWCQSKG